MRKCKVDKTALAFKYWNTPKWIAHFKSQITKAQQLCNVYGEIPVIRAVKKNERLYSLRVPYLENSIKKEVLLYEQELKNRVETEIPTETKGLGMTSMPKGTNLFGEI